MFASSLFFGTASQRAESGSSKTVSGHVRDYRLHCSRILQVPRIPFSFSRTEVCGCAQRPCRSLQARSLARVSACVKHTCSSWVLEVAFVTFTSSLSHALRLPVLGGAQIIAFAGLIETTGFFQAASTTDGRGPREGQFSMKDSTETGEPGNYGVGFPNFLGKVEDPEARKSKLAAELANGRLAMMVT